MPTNVEQETTAVRGDRIVVESEKVGTPAREGEILEVTETAAGRNFEVRWDDGHVSSFRPAAGSARIFKAANRERKPKG
jgi:Domain of unknown function (DUF1918)